MTATLSIKTVPDFFHINPKDQNRARLEAVSSVGHRNLSSRGLWLQGNKIQQEDFEEGLFHVKALHLLLFIPYTEERQNGPTC